MSYLVIIRDICGIPRAWGMAPTKAAATKEAERQWALRVAERTHEGTLDVSEKRRRITVKMVEG